MRSDRLRGVVLTVAALAVTAWAGRAEASAFQLVEQNGSGLGNAYSGQAAAAEDASTVFWNPAGMTRIPRRQLVGAVNLVRPFTDFSNTGSTGPTGAPATGGDGGDAGDLGVIPNLYFTAEVAPDVLWLGLGLNVPFGLTTDWDDGWIGRFHALKSEVRTINVNPSIAWKAHRFFSIGAGLNWQWVDAELTQALFFGAAGEGAVKLEADDTSWGWNVGAMVELPTNTRIGASYRSKIEHETEGDATFTVPALVPAAQRPPNSDIALDVELPDTFSIAIAQQLAKLQLLADFTWTGWSSIKNLPVIATSGPLAGTPASTLTTLRLNFDDSWRIGLGANYQLTDAFKIRGGVAYDMTPVPNAEDRTPRLPDQDRTWVAAGVQWAFSKAAVVDVGAAYLFIKEARSNLQSPPPPQLRGNLVGNYDADVLIASAQARFSF